MLSVLIPTYNDDVRPLLLELDRQRSTLADPVEIIVWDDASKEDMTKYEADLNLSEVQFQRNVTNLGRSATRDLLAQRAKFDWVLFLDADTLPINSQFLKTYLESIQKNTPIIQGGIAYQPNPPESEFLLRWAYGRDREMQTADSRDQNPHLVMTGNILMDKDLFLELNKGIENFYGDDLIISSRIKENQIQVLNLDNPVWHLGLEPSETYLNKLMESDQMRKKLEAEGAIAPDLTSIQRAYHRYKTVMPLFKLMYSPLVKNARKQLLGNNPSMRTLDLYRMFHYAKYN